MHRHPLRPTSQTCGDQTRHRKNPTPTATPSKKSRRPSTNSRTNSTTQKMQYLIGPHRTHVHHPTLALLPLFRSPPSPLPHLRRTPRVSAGSQNAPKRTHIRVPRRWLLGRPSPPRTCAARVCRRSTRERRPSLPRQDFRLPVARQSLLLFLRLHQPAAALRDTRAWPPPPLRRRAARHLSSRQHIQFPSP